MSLFETPDLSDVEESESSEDEGSIDENDNVLDKIVQAEMKEVPAVGRLRNKKVAASVEEVTVTQKESKVPEKEQNQAIKPTVERLNGPKREPTQLMVDNALTALNEKYGSSVVAIKTYILANYTIPFENRLRLQIWKYLKKSVEEGKIEQKKLKFKLIVQKKANAIKADKKAMTLKKKVDPMKKTEQPKKGKGNGNVVKVKMAEKTSKKLDPSNSGDVLKKRPTKKEKKATEPTSTSNRANSKNKSEEKEKVKAKAKSQGQAKPKRALYDNIAVGVGPAKAPKKSAAKSKLTENPSESPIFEVASSSKRNGNKRNGQRTKN